MTHSNLTNSANSSNIQQPSTPNSSQSIHNKSPQQKIYEWFKKFPNFENKTPEKIDQTLDSLIANKSFLNSQDPLGNNALHLAIAKKDLDTAKKLVASGIDYHAKNNQGYNYLDIARNNGDRFFQTVSQSFLGSLIDTQNTPKIIPSNAGEDFLTLQSITASEELTSIAPRISPRSLISNPRSSHPETFRARTRPASGIEH